MNIWVYWNRANGENFVTTHLTEKGACLAAITDILNWYGASDDPDYFFKTLSERGTGNPMATIGLPKLLPLILKKI